MAYAAYGYASVLARERGNVVVNVRRVGGRYDSAH